MGCCALLRCCCSFASGIIIWRRKEDRPALEQSSAHRKDIATMLTCVLPLLSLTAASFVASRQVLAFALIPQRQSWSRQAQSDFTMQQLRRRHREAPPRSFLSSSLQNGEGGDVAKDFDTVANEALQSIIACYRACFAASFSDLLVSIIDDNLWSKLWSTSGVIIWTDWIDLVDSLNVLIFGLGLRRVSKLYFASLQDRERRMSEESVLDLMRTMARIWGSCALSLGLVSLSMASSLHHQGAFALGMSTSYFTGTFLSVLAIANGIIRAECRSTINDALAKGDIDNKSKETQNEGREMGYRAYRNQALCAGGFGIMSMLELVKWLINKDQAGIVGRIFAIPDILTPASITTLLFALNKSFLPAYIAATRKNGNGAKEGNRVDDTVYNQLFAAQKGFYSKVGATLKSAAIFRVLPYIVTPIIPYLVKVAELVLPSPLLEKLKSVVG